MSIRGFFFLTSDGMGKTNQANITGHLVNTYGVHDSFLLYSIQLHNFGIGLGRMCMLVDFRAAPQFLGLLMSALGMMMPFLS